MSQARERRLQGVSPWLGIAGLAACLAFVLAAIYQAGVGTDRTGQFAPVVAEIADHVTLSLPKGADASRTGKPPLAPMPQPSSAPPAVFSAGKAELPLPAGTDVRTEQTLRIKPGGFVFNGDIEVPPPSSSTRDTLTAPGLLIPGLEHEDWFYTAALTPVSGLRLQVGAGSLAKITQALNQGQRPPADEVHIDELINSFEYQEIPPAPGETLGVRVEIAQAPWALNHRLARITIKARNEPNGKDTSAPLVAEDVRALVHFNAALISSYRLLGCEMPAGPARAKAENAPALTDMHAGHLMTALYEIVPTAVTKEADTLALMRDMPGKTSAKTPPHLAARPPERRLEGFNDEMLTVKIRYKKPGGQLEQSLEVRAHDHHQLLEDSTEDFRFAAAVAGFGLLLKQPESAKGITFATVRELALKSQGKDTSGLRREFIDLVEKASRLAGGP